MSILLLRNSEQRQKCNSDKIYLYCALYLITPFQVRGEVLKIFEMLCTSVSRKKNLSVKRAKFVNLSSTLRECLNCFSLTNFDARVWYQIPNRVSPRISDQSTGWKMLQISCASFWTFKYFWFPLMLDYQILVNKRKWLIWTHRLLTKCRKSNFRFIETKSELNLISVWWTENCWNWWHLNWF